MAKKIIKGSDLVDMIDTDVYYDEEDLALLEEMKTQEYYSLKETNPEKWEKELEKYVKAAKQYKEKKQVITIRLYRNDVNKIKQIAENEGMPYQTLLSAIIHKVANGKVNLNLETE